MKSIKNLSVVNRVKEADWADVVQNLLLLIEIVALVYMNFFHIGDAVDQDFASLINHAVQMGDNHKLLLPFWDYDTTGEFDCGMMPAVIIYMITKNIFFSYALSNVLSIALWIFVVWKLLTYAGLDKKYKTFVLTLVFCLYEFGSLSYNNMMFFAGSQYVYKALLPLLFATLIMTPKEKRKAVGTIFLYVVTALLCFLSGLSSSNYVLVCGIFPMLVVLIVFTIAKGKDENSIYRLIVSVSVVILLVIGAVLCSKLGIDPDSESIILRAGDFYIEGFNLVINYLIHTLVGMAGKAEGISATSLAGIVYVMRWIVFIFVMWGVVSASNLFGIKRFIHKDTKGDISEKELLDTLMISAFLWNFFIMFLTVTETRYHLISIVPLFICGAIRLENVFGKKIDISRIFIGVISAFLIVIELFACIVQGGNFFKHIGVYYAINYEECNDIVALLDEHDVNTAFITMGNELNSSLRVVDKTKVYEIYHPDTGWVQNVDYYETETDRSAFDDRNVIITNSDNLDEFPYYIRDNYRFIGQVYENYLYLSEANPIDGTSKMYKGLETIDLATTPGYTVVGDIDGNGYLSYDGGNEILRSPDIKIDQPITWTVNYTLENNGQYACVVVYKDGEGVGEYPFDASTDTLTIDIDEPGTYQFSVLKFNEGHMQLREMRFNVK